MRGQTCHICNRSHGRADLFWPRVGGRTGGVKGYVSGDQPVCWRCLRARYPEQFWDMLAWEPYRPLVPFITCPNRRAGCWRCYGSGYDAERLTGILLVLLAGDIRSLVMLEEFRIRVVLAKKPYAGPQFFDASDLLQGLIGVYLNHYRYTPEQQIREDLKRLLVVPARPEVTAAPVNR